MRADGKEVLRMIIITMVHIEAKKTMVHIVAIKNKLEQIAIERSAIKS